MPIPRGRLVPKREIAGVRSITREDLPRLLKPRDKSASMPQRLRDSHHNVARLLAGGMDNAQVAALTGYSYNRIHQLSQSPAMKELIAHYRGQIDAVWQANMDAYASLAVKNMIAAERQLSDRLDEADAEGEVLPVRELVAISADRADRFGYGKRQTNINVNADFASMLEKAIARSGKVIDGTAESAPPPARVLNNSSPQPPDAVPAQPLIRRRA